MIRGQCKLCGQTLQTEPDPVFDAKRETRARTAFFQIIARHIDPQFKLCKADIELVKNRHLMLMQDNGWFQRWRLLACLGEHNLPREGRRVAGIPSYHHQGNRDRNRAGGQNPMKVEISAKGTYRLVSGQEKTTSYETGYIVGFGERSYLHDENDSPYAEIEHNGCCDGLAHHADGSTEPLEFELDCEFDDEDKAEDKAEEDDEESDDSDEAEGSEE